MSIISTTIPTDPELLEIAWQKQIQEHVIEQFNITWKNPLNYLKLKTISNDEIHNKAVLYLLNKYMPLWKTENSPNITQFKSILDSNQSYSHLITLVLISCMKKNSTNIEFIRRTLPTDMTGMASLIQRFDTKKFKNYSNLKDLSITADYLDCIFEYPSQMIGLLIDHRESIFNTHANILSLNKLITQFYIHHIFTNQRIYNLLLNDPNNDKPVLTHYLNYLLRVGPTPNLLIIMSKFKTIFNTKQDQLIAMVGLSLLLEKDIKEYSDIQQIINTFSHFFQTTYPIEFNVFKTLRSLDITDMSLILNSTLNGEILNNIEPVELPELCL